MPEKPTCILLLDKDEYVANAAEVYCQTLYDVVCVERCSRRTVVLPNQVYDCSLNYKVDYLFNFWSPLKVPLKILNNIKKNAINFHPAPPAYPGVGCASYALFNRDETYGVTAHIMEESYDSGEILKVLEFPVLPDDTCDTLFDRSRVYSLVLFYDILHTLAYSGRIDPPGLKWAGPAKTRKEFERWMTINPSDSEEIVKEKIRSLKSRKFAGPYLQMFGETFVFPLQEDKNASSKKNS